MLDEAFIMCVKTQKFKYIEIAEQWRLMKEIHTHTHERACECARASLHTHKQTHEAFRDGQRIFLGCIS